jgi:choline kinase
MKAVILAAGAGTRLGKYTEELPKTLVDVGGFPILAHTLNSIIECGITDIMIVTGYEAGKVEKFVEGMDIDAEYDVEYIYNKKYGETNNIYSIYLTRDILEGESFVLINSDVLFHPDILKGLVNSPKRGVILSVDFTVEIAEEEMKVKVEGDRIVAISKEIPPEEADGEYIGITRIDAIGSTEFFDAVSKTLRDEGYNVFYEAAFQRMIVEGEYVTFEDTGGLPWIEIDTPEDLHIARKVVAPKILGG